VINTDFFILPSVIELFLLDWAEPALRSAPHLTVQSSDDFAGTGRLVTEKIVPLSRNL
jgi:hypothetical protein